MKKKLRLPKRSELRRRRTWRRAPPVHLPRVDSPEPDLPKPNEGEHIIADDNDGLDGFQ